jgi:hypothetical protein
MMRTMSWPSALGVLVGEGGGGGKGVGLPITNRTKGSDLS